MRSVASRHREDVAEPVEVRSDPGNPFLKELAPGLLPPRSARGGNQKKRGGKLRPVFGVVSARL